MEYFCGRVGSAGQGVSQEGREVGEDGALRR